MAAANYVHESVINAINQLNANKAALVQQVAAMSLNNNPRPPAQITVPVPPMQQLTIPMQVSTWSLQFRVHSQWDVEDDMVKVDEADEVAVEDKANAHCSHTTCRTKRKDEVDVETAVVSQSH